MKKIIFLFALVLLSCSSESESEITYYHSITLRSDCTDINSSQKTYCISESEYNRINDLLLSGSIQNCTNISVSTLNQGNQSGFYTGASRSSEVSNCE